MTCPHGSFLVTRRLSTLTVKWIGIIFMFGEQKILTHVTLEHDRVSPEVNVFRAVSKEKSMAPSSSLITPSRLTLT
jgi:hypothetical protein